MRRLRTLLSPAARPLQDRLAILIAIAVAAAVATTAVAAYLMTQAAAYAQLDNELLGVASITSGALSDDLENMGGIDTMAMRAANVNVNLVRSDGHVIVMPGRQTALELADQELAIARTSMGWSARTGTSTQGEPMRIVSVPMVSDQSHYALAIGRSLGPTTALLQATGLALAVFGGIGGTVAAAVGYVIAKSGVQPIRKLSDAVASVAATTKLDPVEIEGDDEVADLGRTFNRMLEALESSRERQRRLIADAGHELRTPLTSMRTNVELLVADERQGMLPEGARGEILRDVSEQLGEFTQLVGDLVQLSREETVQPAPEPIDVRDVVESALARVKRRGPGLSWVVTLEPLYLVGEPDALERAITNLMDNAVKFSPPGGTVTVELIGQQLRVADQGPGIAEDDLPHVFERFYRSDKARTTPGSGLGLSIVAQTIQAHGGWVKAGRAPEGGAEFLAYLPGSQTPPEDERDDEEPDAALAE